MAPVSTTYLSRVCSSRVMLDEQEPSKESHGWERVESIIQSDDLLKLVAIINGDIMKTAIL